MKGSRGTLIGVGTLVLFLGILVFVPRFLQQHHFQAPVERAELGQLPLGQALSQIESLSTKPSVGKKASLASFCPPRGSLILNFWATWCPPCLEELPSLEQLHRQLLEKGSAIRVVSISVDDKLENLQRLVPTLSFRFSLPVLWDPNGALGKSWGTEKYPETFWVDAKGNVLYKWVGPQDWLSTDILALLASHK